MKNIIIGLVFTLFLAFDCSSVFAKSPQWKYVGNDKSGKVYYRTDNIEWAKSGQLRAAKVWIKVVKQPPETSMIEQVLLAESWDRYVVVSWPRYGVELLNKDNLESDNLKTEMPWASINDKERSPEWLVYLGLHFSPKLQAQDRNSFSLIDLTDNTEKYAGDTLTIILAPDRLGYMFSEKPEGWRKDPNRDASGRLKGDSLRDWVGSDVDFFNGQFRIRITIPKGLSVPNSGHAEFVKVTFVCEKGDLKSGNRAISIERP